MYLPNLKSVVLPFLEIIGVKFLGGGCEPPILGKERPQGVGDGTIERALVNSYVYRLPIVTYYLRYPVSQSTNVTDRQTDRRRAIPVLCFALKCIAR